ncbi:Dolichyl-phosphate-mannose-protein mannosyltransferase 1 [Smittium mucronatum]|uniref:Dolichyl-phosphate-mannose--protein mannosyltransferase n=1 Tax=Smittium mucronatum TaxID=133383 RepID=A0A1R0GW96_9FUNG|nr:Dolichyl-phosphate-mannose-protein mannosyltransferase 1 [Smittium mucronatum]
MVQENKSEPSAVSSSVQKNYARKRNVKAELNGFSESDSDSTTTAETFTKHKETPVVPPPSSKSQSVVFTSVDYLLIFAISIFAILFRTYNLSHPTEVVFDEVHFGKFAGKYINRTYFFDLHPPIAKMMFALAGYLDGYNGLFSFDNIGQDLVANNVHYLGMRLLSALAGALIVPASYVTIRACGFSIYAACFAAFSVCFENGLITQSRLILLDSILVFFSVYTVMFYSLFRTVSKAPYSIYWWSWLALTGFNLGCALSSKWIALFLVAFIGVCTIVDLWDMIADTSISPRTYFNQFLARAVCLIAIPLSVYVLSFVVHFQILDKIEKPDSGFSTEFNRSFIGGDNSSTMKHIYFGSTIRIKHTNTNGGFLHSHSHDWEGEKSSKQQQVTIYSYPDGNNLFRIIPAYNVTLDSAVQPVRDGDIVRLKHITTGKNIHSHNVKPPVSTGDDKFEVSAYGAEDFDGDSNDDFRLEIVSSKNKKNSDGTLDVEAINTKFRLIHVNMNCALFNSRKKLPKYAFEQFEVLCMRNCRPKMSTWHIENAEFISPDSPELVNNETTTYHTLSTWQKIVEYNSRMIAVNNELIGDHPFASRPGKWPFLFRGTAYWGGKGSVIYQLGNPLVWWFSSTSVILFCLFTVVNHLYYKRTSQVLIPAADNFSIQMLVTGYLLHYLPFFIIGRELFLHHYFAALWFSIMVFASFLDAAITFYTAKNMKDSKASKFIKPAIFAFVSLAFLYSFYVFMPIAYGGQMTKSQCQSMKWRDSWDIDCSHAI